MEDDSDHSLGPTSAQINEIRKFVLHLSELRQKLEDKKQKSHNIIRSKMKDLHLLIDKWENIFLDTMSETLDEKIENLSKQEDKLSYFLNWVEEQSSTRSLSNIFPNNVDYSSSTDINEDDTEEPFRTINEDLAGDEDEEEKPEEEIVKDNFKFWKNIKFPLKPSGVTAEEVDVDLYNEFGQLLEENRKSFKRSLLFVGGIIRAYMRRGHKKDEWVAMLRRLEARVESSPYNDFSDADFVISPCTSYIPRDAYIFSSIWIAVNDVYKYRSESSYKDSLSKQITYLHNLFPTQVEFYLPQFVVCLLNYKEFPLTEFLMKKCKEQFHFSLSVYFLISSISQTGPQSWQKRGLKILKKIIEQLPSAPNSPNKFVVNLLYNNSKKDDDLMRREEKGTIMNDSSKSHGLKLNVHNLGDEEDIECSLGSASQVQEKTPVSNKDSHSENNPLSEYEAELKRLTTIQKTNQLKKVEKILEIPAGKEYFFVQVKFARKLISISKKLGEIYGKSELYHSLLIQELKSLDLYIKNGYSYLPHIANVRSRILNFILPECHPIPTYGRVLYKIVVEVVDLPNEYSKKMGDEYVKLNEDFLRLAVPAESSSLLNTKKTNFRSRSATVNRMDVEVAQKADPQSFNSKSASFENPTRTLRTKLSDEREDEKDNSTSDQSKTTKVPEEMASVLEKPKYNTFGEHWKDMRKRIKSQSIYSNLPRWDLRSYIIKYGDFVLQEQFVMQFILQFQRIWDMENLSLKLFYYEITALSYQSGLIQVVPNSISLDRLKRDSESNEGDLSLLEVFKREWPAAEDFKCARSNFVSSMAAYSIVCYLLQIKDRHNGNIMLNSDGYLFHLDFGYLLTRTIKFEKAPFKLTDEFIEVMGGFHSKSFKVYCNLCVRGFLAIRKHYEKILLIVEMSLNRSKTMPCFDADNITADLRRRFHLDWDDKMCEEYIVSLISEARDNWRTQIYDTYQRIVNDIH